MPKGGSTRMSIGRTVTLIGSKMGLLLFALFSSVNTEDESIDKKATCNILNNFIITLNQ